LVVSITNADCIPPVIYNINARGEPYQAIHFNLVFNEIVATSLEAARNNPQLIHQSHNHHQYAISTRQDILNLIQDLEEKTIDFFTGSSIHDQLERIAVLLRKEYVTRIIYDYKPIMHLSRDKTSNLSLLIRIADFKNVSVSFLLTQFLSTFKRLRG